MFNLKFPYRDRVPQHDDSDPEDNEGLLQKEGAGSNPQSSKRSNRRSVASTVGLNLVVFVAAFALGCFFTNYQKSLTQHWSAVLADVDVTYKPTRFNGSFLHLNIYRQDASPEVDAAWEELGINARPLAVPEEHAAASGIGPDHVRINPKYGGGYPGNVEGLHHLHCLNLVRRALVWNYDYYVKLGDGAFQNEHHIVKDHVTHCLDIVRQQLMCQVDTGLLGQVWWGTEEKPEPFVDFMTTHQCKNYEDIKTWALARQLPPADQTPADFLLPPRSAADILPDIP